MSIKKTVLNIQCSALFFMLLLSPYYFLRKKL